MRLLHVKLGNYVKILSMDTWRELKSQSMVLNSALSKNLKIKPHIKI